METWRDVVGFESTYQVSDVGQVRSLRPPNFSQRRFNEADVAEMRRLTAEGVSARKIALVFGVSQTVISKILRGAAYKNTICVLRPAVRRDGYRFVTLSVDNKHFHKTVHGLVAEAFIGKRPKGHHVNHKDGDKTNNAVSNLEYVTPSGNARHSRAILENAEKLNPDKVRKIRDEVKKGVPRKEIARKFNISVHLVNAVWRKIAWGYITD
jgi:DNA-binding transcriptional regulator YiaG